MDMQTEKIYKDWLTLSQVKGLSNSACHQLLAKFKTPEKILSCEPDILLSLGLVEETVSALHSPDIAKLDKTLEWLDNSSHHLITINDTDYPELLKQIHSAPIVLFAIGERQALANVYIAIVGSRNPSESGKKIANNFAYELSLSGFSICSGLALGIDYQGHLGALKANQSTIAVLGNGPDRIYPAKHKTLASEIAKTGLLLSEFFPGTSPLPYNFPRRNRIISGLSVGVIVIEAAKKSGSLITANFAMEQGREVFAVPGSIYNPLARGTHSLIKQGAKLIETTEDIIEELSPLVNVVINSTSQSGLCSDEQSNLDPYYNTLLNSMGYDDVSIDYLVQSSGLTADVVSSMLLILELEGMVESRHGGKYCRCK